MQIDLDGTDRRLLYLEVLALIATAAGFLSAFLSWTDLRLADGLDFGTPSAVDFVHHYLSMNGYAFFFPVCACAVLGVSMVPMIARRRMSTYATAVSAVVLLMDLVADVLGYCFLSWNTGWLAYTVETWDRMMIGAYLFTVSAILCTVLNAAVLSRSWRVKGHHGFNRRMWIAAMVVAIIGIAVAYGWYLYTIDDEKGPHIDDEYEISSLVLVSDGTELPGSSGVVVYDASDLESIRSAAVMLRDPDGNLSAVTGYAVSDGLPEAPEPGGVYGYTVSYDGLSSTVYAVAAVDDLRIESDVAYTAAVGAGGTRYTFDMLDDGTISLSGRLVGGITVETRGHALDLRIDGLEIVGCTGAPLEIVKAGTVTMTVSGDSSIVDYAPKAWKLESYALHCGGDLGISGDGSLSLYSGNLGGLRTLGSLTIDGASLSVDSMKTSIRAKGEISIPSGAVDTVSRNGDGIHGRTFSAGSDSPASVTVMAADDGIQGKRGVTMQGDSLSVTVLTDRYSPHTIGAPEFLEPDQYDRNDTKGHSCKGIKSDGDMVISGGTYSVSSRDDALHTNGRMTISGGTFDICSGDDGMHADGNITISDASIRMRSYEGIEGDLITLQSGDYTIFTEDDGINASYGDHGGVVVNGGRFYIVAEGDGFDSNLERKARGVTFNGGELFIWSTAGQAGVDTEQGYTFNGGHVVMVCVPGVASMQSTYCSDASQFSYGCAVPGPGFMTVTGNGASMTVATTEDRSSLLVALGFGDSAVFSVSAEDPGGLDANGVRWDLRYHDALLRYWPFMSRGPLDFRFHVPSNIVFGRGKADLIGSETARIGRRALIVTGRSSARTGLLQRIEAQLDQEGVGYVVFDRVSSNPLTTTVEEGATLLKETGCDVVLAVGGGSPLDAAKGISVLAATGGDINDFVFKRFKGEPRAFPIVAVPTTCGTGSESNGTAILTNPETKDKKGLGYDCLIPRASIVDPSLMETMPRSVAGPVMFDALCHSMESYVSPGSNPFSEALALCSLENLAENIVRASDDIRDEEAVDRVTLAATMAGAAFYSSGLQAPHGMEHPLSGLKGIVHGRGLAALTPNVYEHSIPGDPMRFDRISRSLGGKDESDCADSVRRLLSRIDLEVHLSDEGFGEDDVPWLTENCFKVSRARVEGNVKPLSREEVSRIYLESMRCLYSMTS